MQQAVCGCAQTGKKRQKKAAELQRLLINYINIVGAQEGTRTPTKLLAST